MNSRWIGIAGLAFACIGASGQDDVHIPTDLEDWRDWVLHGEEYRACPFLYNSTATERNDFICAWPGQLDLSVTAAGGRFHQVWTVYAKEQWIPLPGDGEVWPRAVATTGGDVSVVLRDGVPAILLSPGRHDVRGSFAWDERPATLAVPRESGLLSLTVDGQRITLPRSSDQGVWLGQGEEVEKAQDTLVTKVYRRLDDDVPTRLLTVFEIDVAGTVREERIGPVLPEGFVPLSLASELPVQLSPDGEVRVQVRPGTWLITLGARAPDVVESVTLPQPADNLPDQEVWAYQANAQLRATLPQGPRTVDPEQVGSRWPELATFLVEPGESLNVVEHSRGLASADNALQLNRRLWLDFDGTGFAFADAITGEMRGGWRLDMATPYLLQNAEAHGDVLLVTENDALAGVEVRNADVEVAAQGRIDTPGEIPVAGWNAGFDTVAATLNVPPGHKLLTALGVDHAPSSWTGRWKLLDFFLLLIIVGAATRLLGRWAGAAALVAMTLGFHEPAAPLWTWLNLLAAVALVRVAPQGRLVRVAKSYRLVSFAVLLLFLVPFLLGQIRIAVFPQLEPLAHRQGHAETWGLFEMLTRRTSPSPGAMLKGESAVEAERHVEEVVVVGAPRRLRRYDENALLQAGPGRPDWEWTSYSLSWDGPVDTERTMRLVIMPDWLVTVLRFVAVGALGAFAALFAYDIFGARWKWPPKIALRSTGATAAVAVFAVVLAGDERAWADPPPAEVLDELKQRLLAPPSCAPRCAEIVDADVVVEEGDMTVRLIVHAVEDVAVPMPGTAQGWRPQRIRAGQADLAARRGSDGVLRVGLDAGRHELTLQGPLPPGDTVEIPFAATPRSIAAHSDHWFVAGIRNRALVARALNLTRLQQATDRLPASDDLAVARWEQSRLPVFLRVDRYIDLRLDWGTANVVYRVAPKTGAINVEIPLLEGEAVLDEGVAVGEGGVLVSMNPSQREFEWNSTLPRQPSMTLTAPTDQPWREVWVFDIGNAWHVDFEGIPESLPRPRSSGWRVAVFHPRPGETLNVSVSRPEPVAGGTLAFDHVAVHTTLGAHQRGSVMEIHYRSTQGTSHRLRLPQAANLESVTIDGDSEPVIAVAGELTVPILPGEHMLTVAWNEVAEPGLRLRTPKVELGTASSNIVSSLTIPSNRWLMFTTGPTLGPAVLYWPELIALILASLILGRLRSTPLRTHDWLLLGLGFSTSFWLAFAAVAVWLIVHGTRKSWGANISEPVYRISQIGFGVLTLAAFAAIVAGIGAGLLGNPDMSVTGYASVANELRWFADQTDNAIPEATAYSVPLWAYKVLILAWALWLAFALIRWLPWVWHRFSEEGLWYRREPAPA
ncbi:MAG: hypothetical protein OXK76_11910 [Gammaproteobacteria bacterium]|nr:hypothetical protein [Gammaproteobacteria bacterium]